MPPQSSMSASTSDTSPVDSQEHRANIALSVTHPRMETIDPASIRTFLRNYDHYCKTVIARAKKIASRTTSTEATLHIELKYCVDSQYLTSAIALGFISGVTSYQYLTSEQLRKYLDEQSKETKEAMTMDALDELVEKDLVVNIKNRNAHSRMQSLFIDYHALLTKHGLSWIIEENPKLAVIHIISAVRPVTLKERLEADISFSYHTVRKDFPAFLKHAVKLSEAFQLVDAGPRSKMKPKNEKEYRSGSHGASNSDKKDTNKETPLCLREPHRSRGLRHLLKDCKDCPADEKRRLKQQFADQKNQNGPAYSTRSKTKSDSTQEGSGQEATAKPKTVKLSQNHSSPGCLIILRDTGVEQRCRGRCGDGSDETLIFPRVAEQAVLNSIGRMTKIPPVQIQVALNSDEAAQIFSFSRSWTVPQLILQLSAGNLALRNFRFLVADDDLVEDDLLIGRPVLEHLGIDSWTMLDERRQQLDDKDCFGVTYPTNSKSVGRLIFTRFHHTRTPGTPDPNRPRSHYSVNRQEVNPFPNPSLLDVNDTEHEANIKKEVEHMLNDATECGLPTDRQAELRTLVYNFIDIFRVVFSPGPGANIPPLKINFAQARVRSKSNCASTTKVNVVFSKNLPTNYFNVVSSTKTQRQNGHVHLT